MNTARADRERGTVTLWVLGLCVSLMFLGGLNLDLWRAISDRRELSSIADAAATAGANGLDEDRLRAGVLRVDPVRARALARSTMAADMVKVDDYDIVVTGNRVTVTLRDHVDFSLLGIFMGGDRFEVEVHASAEPHERA